MADFTDDTGALTTITDTGGGSATGLSDRGYLQIRDSNINAFDINALVYNDVQLFSTLVINAFTDDVGASTGFTDDEGVSTNFTDD